MENDTGEMHDLDISEIEDVAPYLKENLDVFVMMYQ
jgi:translation elongation factor P/translation initiation factor 5A